MVFSVRLRRGKLMSVGRIPNPQKVTILSLSNLRIKINFKIPLDYIRLDKVISVKLAFNILETPSIIRS